MPGKLDAGFETGNAGNIQNSQAYCEGRTYRAQGDASTNPINNNPHETNSEAAISWDLGWNQVDGVADGASFIGRDRACAACGIVAV